MLIWEKMYHCKSCQYEFEFQNPWANKIPCDEHARECYEDKISFFKNKIKTLDSEISHYENKLAQIQREELMDAAIACDELQFILDEFEYLDAIKLEE